MGGTRDKESERERLTRRESPHRRQRIATRKKTIIVNLIKPRYNIISEIIIVNFTASARRRVHSRAIIISSIIN